MIYILFYLFDPYNIMQCIVVGINIGGWAKLRAYTGVKEEVYSVLTHTINKKKYIKLKIDSKMPYLCHMIAAAIIGYILGYIAAYLIFRMTCREDLDHYTVGDRLFNLFMSLGSWCTFIVVLIVYVSAHISDITDIDTDKEAKW